MKSTEKLEVQVICGFFIHYVSVKKIIKAVKFQKVGLSQLALNKCISYEFTLPQNKKSKLIYRAWIKANNENKFQQCSL